MTLCRGLSAGNVVGMQLCDPIDSRLTRWRRYEEMDAVAESGRNSASKHLIQAWRMSRLTRDGTAGPDSQARMGTGK